MSARPVTVWTLELTDPAGIVAPARAAPDGLQVARETTPGTSARFYRAVGGPYEWTDRAHWTEDRWEAWERQAETWVAREDGIEAGYYELRRDAADGSVELAFFGLLGPSQGRGLGGHLLTDALRRAFALGPAAPPRVVVRTCSLDGPHALANYQARGLRVSRQEETLR